MSPTCRAHSCSDAAKRHARDLEFTADSPRYGTVTVRAWTRLHQKLARTGRWAHYPEDQRLPTVRGTVIQVVVRRLPDGRRPSKDLWLWHAGPVLPDVDLLWKAYLRRFDQEHFHRFTKACLGMARAHLDSAQATDRWVNLVMVAYAQLRPASPLVDDLRRPWQPRPEPGKPLSPYRVRLGFRRLRAKLGTPADSPKPSQPGSGRPKGSRNRPKAKRPPYRATDKPDKTGPEEIWAFAAPTGPSTATWPPSRGRPHQPPFPHRPRSDTSPAGSAAAPTTSTPMSRSNSRRCGLPARTWTSCTVMSKSSPR
jgi:hypothetical protein